MKLSCSIPIILATLFLLSPIRLAAQTNGQSPSISIRVSATILPSTANLVTMQEIRFDNVQPSQGEIYVNPVTNVNAGLLKAEGVPNAPVRIVFQRQLELNRVGGTETLTFFYEVSGSEEDNQNTSEILEQETRTLQLNENGNYFIWIGGRVNIQNAVSGQYEGEFTLEVEYI